MSNWNLEQQILLNYHRAMKTKQALFPKGTRAKVMVLGAWVHVVCTGEVRLKGWRWEWEVKGVRPGEIRAIDPPHTRWFPETWLSVVSVIELLGELLGEIDDVGP